MQPYLLASSVSTKPLPAPHLLFRSLLIHRLIINLKLIQNTNIKVYEIRLTLTCQAFTAQSRTFNSVMFLKKKLFNFSHYRNKTL